VTAPVLISVVLSFRNEEEVIPELVDRLRRSLTGAGLDYELIFVNDASTDRSLALLEEQRARDRRVKILNMSRRFGVAPCVVAGMRHARGDALVYMDADLQDPPELIPELVARWREGADVVYTVRTARRGESRLKMALTQAAYRTIRAVSEIDLPVEAGDFRLLSRRALERLLELEESDLYLRGLASWIGFRQVAVPYERQARGGGQGHFPLLGRGPLTTFLAGVTSFSNVPLVSLLVIGALGIAASLLALLLYAVRLVAGSDPSAVSGLVPLAALAWSSLVLALGILAVYVGRIHREVLRRPRYLVESAIGFDDPA
jgi:dolichol-phosphate mannosyltransferase